MVKEYQSANVYCRRIFGGKVYKLAMSASTSCPNRDGTVGFGGCAFCSQGGSGDFASSHALPVREQIEKAKKLLAKKGEGVKYIAYFQSYTGTYGDIERLERIYTQAAEQPDISGLSIATRPDCLGARELAMLKRLSEIKPLWVELGLQTANDRTAEKINRCYPTVCYESAMDKLGVLDVHRITHVIFGLPGETRSDMLKTVEFVSDKTDGIKLQLLHVLKNTALEKRYEKGEFEVLAQSEYNELVADALEILPLRVVIHRLTGDGAKKDLIAPLWSADKKNELNQLNKVLKSRGIVPLQQ